MANDRWTRKDERELAELLVRKTRVENTRRERLSRALSNCPGMDSSVVPRLADSLISNAAEVCSALELYVLADAEAVGEPDHELHREPFTTARQTTKRPNVRAQGAG